MKVVAVIEPRALERSDGRGAVIKKISRHCGLWRPSWASLRNGGRRPLPVVFPSPASENRAGDEGDLTDWPDADWVCHPAEDFDQIGPDDSAYADIDSFGLTFPVSSDIRCFYGRIKTTGEESNFRSV